MSKFRKHVVSTLMVAALVVGISSTAKTSIADRIINREDTIVMTGAKFPGLSGAEISSLNMLVWRDGKVVAIPFQVDEIRSGKHVFESATPVAAKQGYTTSDVVVGKCDDDDELVFMAYDMGEQSDPAAMKATAVYAIEATDPVTKKTAYAYLTVGGDVARSNDDYVKLDTSGGRITARARMYEYSQVSKLGYFDSLKIRDGSGKLSPNIVKRNSSPGKGTLKLGISSEFDMRKLIVGELIASKDGPVRALAREAGGANFAGLKIDLKGGTELAFYANRFDMPVEMDIPFNVGSVVKSFVIRLSLFLDPASFPMTFYDNATTGGARMDGKPETGGTTGKPTGDWFAITNGASSLYHTTWYGPEWKPFLKLATFISEDAANTEVGVTVGDVVGAMTKGSHSYGEVYYVIPKAFSWGDEKRVPEIVKQPLGITVKKAK